jgi:hypothetical protein
MDTRKFEQLINLITNEDQEQARALFHDIVVEKSREIYESMMDEDSGLGGQVGSLLDEIDAEESGEGMTEDEEDFGDDEEYGDDFGDDEMDVGDEIELAADDELDAAEGEEDLEDRVVDLEDKLDTLMAEFERQMGSDEDEEAGEEADFDAEQDEEMADQDFADAEGDAEGEEEQMMEAVELRQVKGLYGSKIGGDNGVQPKSAIGNAANKGQTGMASRPVNFAGKDETVPTGPKTASNAYTKGESSVKGAGSFKNAPGQSNKTMAPATKPTTSQPAGTNQKSPVAEARRRK